MKQHDPRADVKSSVGTPEDTSAAQVTVCNGSDGDRAWAGKVYAPPDTRVIPLDVRKAVAKRDNYRCQRCGESGRSVHHIIPYDEGGPDTVENLILLCISCHDWVEQRTDIYRTPELIRCSIDEPVMVKELDRVDEEADWHARVYGSKHLYPLPKEAGRIDSLEAEYARCRREYEDRAKAGVEDLIRRVRELAKGLGSDGVGESVLLQGSNGNARPEHVGIQHVQDGNGHDGGSARVSDLPKGSRAS